jgi:hypothetical protein
MYKYLLALVIALTALSNSCKKCPDHPKPNNSSCRELGTATDKDTEVDGMISALDARIEGDYLKLKVKYTACDKIHFKMYQDFRKCKTCGGLRLITSDGLKRECFAAHNFEEELCFSIKSLRSTETHGKVPVDVNVWRPNLLEYSW